MDEYKKASESVMSELENTQQIEYKVGLDMRGYEVVRSQYFATMKNPAMTIADGKLGFNTSCLKKFENALPPFSDEIPAFFKYTSNLVVRQLDVTSRGIP